MGLGFQVEERFEGTYYRLDAPFDDHAIRLTLTVKVDGVRRFVRERKAFTEGRVWAEELAEGRGGEGGALSGNVAFRLFDEKRIPYDLSFVGDDGRAYRLRGQRDFFVHDAVDSLTILPLSLYDDAANEIGRAVLRFDPKTELSRTIKSLRPTLRVFGRAPT